MKAVLLRNSPVFDSSLNSESRLPLLNDLRSPSSDAIRFSSFQQVGIAGEQRHVFREIHARFFVHCPLVDGTRTHRTAFELAYESLLAVQEVELVAVQ